MRTQGSKRSAILVGIAFLIGLLAAWSTNEWFTLFDRGKVEAHQAKVDLIASAGLFELHNKIYQKVGDRDWKERVRPTFMSAITWETVRETGSLIPGPGDVVAWVRAHPERARKLLEDAAR